MILKDYNHVVDYVDREGSIKQEDVERKRKVIIGVQAEVVIKREGKHYTVPFRKQLEMDLSEYSADILSGFLIHCRMEMEMIDKNWKLVGEVITERRGKIFSETPIEL